MARKREKGATMTELIAVIMIIGIILAPVSLLFYTGYKNYFIEKDTMTAQQKAREAMEAIISDLRMYEYQNSKYDELRNLVPIASSETQLVIKHNGNSDMLVYRYDNGKIYKKLSEAYEILLCDDVVEFKVEEILPAGYDSSLINIQMKVKTGRGEGADLQSSYRRKAPVRQ